MKCISFNDKVDRMARQMIIKIISWSAIFLITFSSFSLFLSISCVLFFLFLYSSSSLLYFSHSLSFSLLSSSCFFLFLSLFSLSFFFIILPLNSILFISCIFPSFFFAIYFLLLFNSVDLFYVIYKLMHLLFYPYFTVHLSSEIVPVYSRFLFSEVIHTLLPVCICISLFVILGLLFFVWWIDSFGRMHLDRTFIDLLLFYLDLGKHWPLSLYIYFPNSRLHKYGNIQEPDFSFFNMWMVNMCVIKQLS